MFTQPVPILDARSVRYAGSYVAPSDVVNWLSIAILLFCSTRKAAVCPTAGFFRFMCFWGFDSFRSLFIESFFTVFYLKHLALKAGVARQFMRLNGELLRFGCMWIDPIQP